MVSTNLFMVEYTSVCGEVLEGTPLTDGKPGVAEGAWPVTGIRSADRLDMSTL